MYFTVVCGGMGKIVGLLGKAKPTVSCVEELLPGSYLTAAC